MIQSDHKGGYMQFHKFLILNDAENSQYEEEVAMLLNYSHIVSIKPIKMTTADRRVLNGYWIRLSNGKKYKALSIPTELKALLDERLPKIQFSADSELSINEIQ